MSENDDDDVAHDDDAVYLLSAATALFPLLHTRFMMLRKSPNYSYIHFRLASHLVYLVGWLCCQLDP